MNIRITESAERPGVRLVSLDGRLDAACVDDIEGCFDRMIARGETRLVLDMRQTSYIGSSGIRILLALNAKLKERSGVCALFGIPSSGLKILRAMQIESLFRIFSSEREAIDCAAQGA